MRVRNIECQLAQGQIRRYLNGDPLSDVAVEQLEDHLSECPDCTEFFQDCKQELIDDKNESEIEEEVYAPAQTSASSEISAVPRFLIDAIRQKRETLDRVVKPIATHAVVQDVREAKPSLNSYTKPLLYSIGLASVLIVMSTIMRDPSKVLGDRVETTLQPNPPVVAKPIAVENDPAADTSQSGSESVENSKPSLNTNRVKNPEPTQESKTVQDASSASNVLGAPAIAKPKPTLAVNSSKTTNLGSSGSATTSKVAVVRRSTTNKTTLRRRTPASRPLAKATPPNRGIRVYDGDGNPISQR